MYSKQIRVEEGNKEALLEALDGLRKTLDFDFQVAHEQHKQREADHGTNRQSKEENCVGSSGRKLHSEATSSSVVVESSDAEENEPTPKEIATELNRWLNHKGVARVEFAKHINRSKSHFADTLNHPPTSLPKGFGKESWLKMHNFLQDKNAQKIFLEKAANKARKKRSVSTTAEGSEPPKKRQRPTTFEKWQMVMLDEIFVKCDGRPEKGTIRRICPTIKLEQRQVRKYCILVFIKLTRLS